MLKTSSPLSRLSLLSGKQIYVVHGVLCMSCQGSLPALTSSTVGSFLRNFNASYYRMFIELAQNISASYTTCKMGPYLVKFCSSRYIRLIPSHHHEFSPGFPGHRLEAVCSVFDKTLIRAPKWSEWGAKVLYTFAIESVELTLGDWQAVKNQSDVNNGYGLLIRKNRSII